MMRQLVGSPFPPHFLSCILQRLSLFNLAAQPSPQQTFTPSVARQAHKPRPAEHPPADHSVLLDGDAGCRVLPLVAIRSETISARLPTSPALRRSAAAPVRYFRVTATSTELPVM